MDFGAADNRHQMPQRRLYSQVHIERNPQLHSASEEGAISVMLEFSDGEITGKPPVISSMSEFVAQTNTPIAGGSPSESSSAPHGGAAKHRDTYLSLPIRDLEPTCTCSRWLWPRYRSADSCSPRSLVRYIFYRQAVDLVKTIPASLPSRHTILE